VDPRILHLSELELVEVRMMEGEPLVVLQFSCQQINCVRNKEGEIVDGAEDDIQAVHYLWAMQLSPKDFVATDGREYSAQTWQLREMVLRGMMAVAA
jgi:import inner membrane translocase subunit TIM44